jgi:RNA polymerase sigma-70 factor (ECF subfamily)
METMGKGDVNLERLYVDVGPAIWNYLRRKLVGRGAAEELLQETFLAAAANPAKLSAAWSERAWLIGIARNLLREHHRRERRQPRPLLDEQSPVVEQAREDEQLQALRAAVARLPDYQREVLELRLAQELSYEEIAEALEIPIGTVRSRIHNAVASLRRWAEDVESKTGVER